MLTRLVFLTVAAAGLLTTSAPAAAATDTAEPTRKLIAVLQSDAGLFDKARACQQLGECGSAEAVPALAALLPDPHLNAYARSGLEGIGDPSAAAALRAALATVKGKPLAGVINSLGVLRDAAALAALRELAAKPDSGVVADAWLAMGRIATSEAIQTLRQALAEAAEALRPSAAAACLLAAETQLAAGQAEAAVSLYDAVRAATVPVTLRAAATRGAILARQSAGVPLLIAQLRSDQRAIRQIALLTIRELPGEAMANALNAELAQAPAELQQLLLIALVDCHNPQSLAVLRAKATGDDAAIRETALTVLGRIGGPAEADVLLSALTDEARPAEAAAALGGLATMAGAAIDERILGALASAGTSATARVKLIRLVAGRAPNNASGALFQQAAADDAKVRVAALAALGALAAAQDLPALLALVKTAPDDAVRGAAESAFCSTCGRTDSGATGGATVLAELQQATDASLIPSWIRMLTRLGHAPALPAIQAALGNTHESVVTTAIDQLGRWPDPGPIDDLLARAESAANPAQRQLALRAAIQLAWAAADQHQRPDEVVAGWLQRAAKAAQSVEDRRLVLSGLGRVKHLASLALLVPYLDQPEVRTEAAVAVIQIAPALVKLDDASAVKQALDKIAATVTDGGMRERAAQLAKDIPSQNLPECLFDGKSLAGWEGDTDIWRVRDGAIVGGSLSGNPANSFLVLAKRSNNFVLRLEYKLHGSDGFINGGVQFRSERVAQPPNEMCGYQADIGAGYTGCLYDESRRNKVLARPAPAMIQRLEQPGAWNRYEVRCTGPRIQILLNGETTVDYTEADATLAQAGLIALQIHGDCKAEIAFRNLTLAQLP